MSNVRPGDFARFLPGHTHAGHTCYVDSAPKPADLEILSHASGYGPHMLVWRVVSMAAGKKWVRRDDQWHHEQSRPGEILLCQDHYLQRIDPPTDDETTDTPATLENQS